MMIQSWYTRYNDIIDKNDLYTTKIYKSNIKDETNRNLMTL